MKKTFLSWLLIGSSCAVFAQVETTTDSLKTTNQTEVNANMNTENVTLTSTGDYAAFKAAVPSNVIFYFERDYPGVQPTSWEQSNEFWRITHKKENRLINVYYNNAGVSYTVAKPVLHSAVPESVIERAISIYGDDIYDITAIKGLEGEELYTVRVIENGQLRAEKISAEGSTMQDQQTTTPAPYYGELQADEDADTTLHESTTNDMNSSGTTSSEDMEMTDYSSLTVDDTLPVDNGGDPEMEVEYYEGTVPREEDYWIDF